MMIFQCPPIKAWSVFINRDSPGSYGLKLINISSKNLYSQHLTPENELLHSTTLWFLGLHVLTYTVLRPPILRISSSTELYYSGDSGFVNLETCKKFLGLLSFVCFLDLTGAIKSWILGVSFLPLGKKKVKFRINSLVYFVRILGCRLNSIKSSKGFNRKKIWYLV